MEATSAHSTSAARHNMYVWLTFQHLHCSTHVVQGVLSLNIMSRCNVSVHASPLLLHAASMWTLLCSRYVAVRVVPGTYCPAAVGPAQLHMCCWAHHLCGRCTTVTRLQQPACSKERGWWWWGVQTEATSRHMLQGGAGGGFCS
jgi:hypothetical protein